MFETQNTYHPHLECEIAILVGKITELDIDPATIMELDRELQQQLTPQELRLILKKYDLHLGEGKTMEHFLQEGSYPNIPSSMTEKVAYHQATQHPVFYNNQKIGELVIKRS